MSNIKQRNGHCGECRFFLPLGKRDSLWNDGICKHPINVKDRKTPYKVYSLAHCCFNAEDPDDNRQISLFDIE